MDERHDDGRRQHAPDMLPLASGSPLAPSHRDHDPTAGPQRSGTLVLTAVGSLLLLALLAWLTLR